MIEIIIILLLFLSDNVLTHYQAFILKKKGCFFPRMEQNPLVRIFLKRFSLGNSMIITFIWQSSIVLLMFWILAWGGLSLYPLWLLMVGMTVIVNMYHSIYIRGYKAMWDKEEYWKMTRMIVKKFGDEM